MCTLTSLIIFIHILQAFLTHLRLPMPAALMQYDSYHATDCVAFDDSQANRDDCVCIPGEQQSCMSWSSLWFGLLEYTVS